jgi:hypothetical protein
MRRGVGARERRVWDRFANRQDDLAAVAASVSSSDFLLAKPTRQRASPVGLGRAVDISPNSGCTNQAKKLWELFTSADISWMPQKENFLAEH